MHISDLPATSPGSSAQFPFDQGTSTYKVTTGDLFAALISVGKSVRFYQSIANLPGYSSASIGIATIANVWAALRSVAPAVLVCRSEEFNYSTQIPGANQYGVVEMAVAYSTSSTARGFINFYSFSDTLGDYRMFLVSGSTPSGVWVKNRTEIDSSLKTFDTVGDLGLTVGSATISGAVSALLNNAPAMLCCDSGDFGQSAVPSQYGVVEIVAIAANRIFINFYGQTGPVGDYRMFLSDGSPSGVWVRDGLFSAEYTASNLTNKVGTFDTGSTVLKRSGNTVAFSFLSTGVSVTTSWATIATVPSSLEVPDSKSIVGVGMADYDALQIRMYGRDLQIRGSANGSNKTVRGTITWIL